MRTEGLSNLERFQGPRTLPGIESGTSRLVTQIFNQLHRPPPSNYYSGYQFKKNEMGWECGPCGGEERCMQGLGGES